MSAYMVNDDTINKIVACLKRNKGIASHLKHCYGFDLDTEQGGKALATRMFVLNKMGVESRYGKGQAKEFRPLDFEFKRTLSPGPMTGIKALQCLLYQCTEGRVDETRFYALLKRIQLWLAMDIIRTLPGYEGSGWG